jgi:predicted dienelactone hydrolase
MRTWIGALALGMALCAEAPAQTPDYAAAGPHPVATMTGLWRDSGRNRDVPYLIRYPAGAAAPLPIVIFSHGLGGTERGAVYYSQHLASHGFAVVHVRHAGSDAAVWGGVRPKPETIDHAALRRAVSNPMVAVDRFRDIPFTLDALRALNGADSDLKGKLDLAHVGMSGHSFGALTTQAAAGMSFGRGGSIPAPGVKAFLAMSPSGARNGDNAGAFARVSGPFMFMSGDEDTFGVDGRPAAEVLASRRAPFDALKRGPAYFLNLKGGDHMVFSGRQEMGATRPSDARHHALISAGALAFFRTYLMNDAAARMWLDGGGLAAFAGADATLEQKP